MLKKNLLILELAGPVIVIAAIGTLWSVANVLFDIPRFLLPSPQDVWVAMVKNVGLLLEQTWATLRVILIGFVISVMIGVPLGYAIVASPRAERTVYPIVVALQFFPKTIIAPLLIVWFGIGIFPKSILVMLMSFFPILVDSALGFRAMDSRIYLVSASMGASPRQTFWRFQFPSALPEIITGMKTSMIYAVIAVIVAEYVGSNDGIGYLILTSSARMDLDLVFAGIIAASLLGVMLSLVMGQLERVLLPWMPHEDR
ncbi:ABC transporter permease [Nitratireductor sp. StC3]|uniref:ABC transporter permease n=1 Tax=Nitratireductor sp. StC3 TaxID=2126741 RepID=UPI000D0CECE9|nr:ABC transporter permease [Nitratireductor sp. StC3]PSM16799.1 ABC transporter permease [Nitratireductor sp. StC3]